MTTYARVQKHIDKGKGKAAHHVGMPFIGYRIGPTSNGHFPTGWTTTVSDFSMLRRRFGEAKLELGIKNVALFYRIVANMDRFLVGDVFVQNDAPFVPGISYGAGATSTVAPKNLEFNAMCLAWHPPENEAIGARIDRRVTVWRPSNNPADVQDATGAPTGATYWKSTNVNDMPLILRNGCYSFADPGFRGDASFVPAGALSAIRQTEWIFQPGVPGMMKEAKWFFYLPPLPGYMPAEGDALIDENGARYVVVVPYEQKTGVSGYQLVCDRKIKSNG